MWRGSTARGFVPADGPPAGAPSSGGDRLVEFYKRYGSMVYARCRQILAEDTAAEDATQETFLRAMDHLERGDMPTSIAGWLYTVATNYCLNDVRNERRRAILTDQVDQMGGGGDQERLPDRDLATRVLACADASVRATAWLCHVDGMTQDEAARILGVSRRTVVDRLARLGRVARKLVEKQ